MATNPNMTINPEKARPIVEFCSRPENQRLNHRQVAAILGVNESYVRRAKAFYKLGETMKLALKDIIVDADIQPRVKLDDATVKEYAEAYERGANLPPLVVFYDGTNYRVADGFHRHAGAVIAKIKKLDVEVRSGEKREAILYAVGANATHGLKRTNADKNRAVTMVLADEEWSKWSDRDIANRCGVSHNFVGDVRTAICNPITDTGTRKAIRNGKEYTVNTVKIGGKSTAQPDHEPEVAAEELTDEERDAIDAGIMAAPVDTPEDEHDYAIDRTGSPKPGEPDDWADDDVIGVTAPPKGEPSPAVKAALAKQNGTLPPAKDGEADEPVRAQSDAEWLDTLPLRAKLTGNNLGIFEKDALDYRHAFESDELRAFAGLVGKMKRSRKNDSVQGEILYRLGVCLGTPHPRSWLLCSVCNGSGCDQCRRRRGYVIP